MKAWRLLIAVGVCLLIALAQEDRTYALDLQQEIDQAAPGAAIVVAKGQYRGPLIIDKPLSIQAEQGATVYNDTGSPALWIRGSNVHIEGLAIVHNTPQMEVPAVKVTGHRNVLSAIDIQTKGTGISLERADDNILSEIAVLGPFERLQASGSMINRQGNGIDLVQSHRNRIEQTAIRQAQDAIYIEHSTNNIVSSNRVSDSRYGIHLMFTENTTLAGNMAERNITGAMVMGTKGTNIVGNRFVKQAGHVHSQGLMLYDVQQATVTGNVLAQNLIGLLIDSSSRNVIKENEIRSNYIGLQMQASQQQQLQRNDFIANSIDALARRSDNNDVAHNYWDGHLGFDADGDRVSNLPFHADPILPALVTQNPAYQIFADSPGLLFFNYVLALNRDEVVTDDAPLMSSNKQIHEANTGRKRMDIVYYGIAFVVSTMIMYGGRK